MDDEVAARRARERRRREDLLAGMRLAARLREANPPSPARAEEERRQRRDRIAGLLRQVEEGDPDASYIDEETLAMLRGELARLDEVTGGGDRPDTDVVRPLITITRRNTILYCRRWRQTVDFYRADLGLAVLARRDWFVEFALGADAALSVADASRTTIDPVDGQGITLSWRVADLAATRNRLVDNGLEPTPVRRVWDAVACYLFDPEGHRIELWSDGPEP
jgi:catechol 2,3-dioxygenase-like lactoylglutathione lyase family enzyme